MSKATADELRLLIRSGWRLIALETFEEVVRVTADAP